MESSINLLKIVGPKMIPFVKAVSLYYILDTYNHHGELWTTFFKCAPIACLIMFIVLYEGGKISKPLTYANKILFGLLSSCVGDALLNHNMFTQGMGAFAVAQLFYINAFGVRPLKLWIGVLLYAGGAIVIYTLHENLEPVILIGLPVYTLLLVTMSWRAIAASCRSGNASLLQVNCALSSALFVISDTLIAIDKYHRPIANSTFWIMTTYYIAQFGITLSVVDAHRGTERLREKQR